MRQDLSQAIAASSIRVPIDIGHTAYAAALSIFGCPITCSTVRSLRSDEKRTLWHVVPVPADCHADIDPRAVLAANRAHELDPLHMFRDALRGIEARKALIRWRKRSIPCRIWRDGPERWSYDTGDAATDDGTGVVRVEGEALAAALGVLGCGAIRPEDGGMWLVRKRGEPSESTGLRYDAAVLCEGLVSGTLRQCDPNHPFLCAWQGAVNYQAMLDTALLGNELLLVNSPRPGDTRHAYMPADAPGWRWDRCRKFLLGK
jgi:hypothetical protein